MAPLGAASDKTREILWHTPQWAELLWYSLAAVSIVIFAYGVAMRVARYRAGRPGGFGTRGEIVGRIRASVGRLVSGRTIARRRAAVGLAHRAAFYGFLVLFAGTVILAINSDITEPLFGWRFFDGNFYLVYSLLLDVFGLMLFAGLVFFLVRRLRDPVLQYSRQRSVAAGDWLFSAACSTSASPATCSRASASRWITRSRPCKSDRVDHGSGARSDGTRTSGVLRHVLWWSHGLVAIGLVAAIPYTKAQHMLSSFTSLVLRDSKAGKRLRAIPEERADEPAGYAQLADFSLTHLLQLDACTKCGKCHEACPAVRDRSPSSRAT